MTIAQLAHLADPALTPRLVVKVGSALLVGADGEPRRGWLSALVGELAEARARGQDVIVVSSGAIALGARRLGLAKGGRGSLADAQAAAAVGQIALAGLWAELLAGYGATAAQVLLTLDDLEDRRRWLNVTATLGTLLARGAVPVINENDTVATEEIRFGDNDRLAARVAQAAEASAVLLLSDIDGLYDRDPRQPGATRIPVVRRVTPDIHAMATAGSSSGLGSGGMTSKLQAAEIAGMAGMALAIIDGRPDRPIGSALASGNGTVFLARPRKAARKAWLGGRMRMRGTVHVDAGAARALSQGASLLAAGVVRVEGTFMRGDAIAVLGPAGEVLARGLTEYDAGECAALAGHNSRDHADILGYAPRSALIHRDHLVLV
ncbi:glutamate 5-kinase [Novosphingobium sp. FSW06-99]|uniref:glutamate 5-kinase n=1 Tax=Novosphingobium sp. FSW06-99 TaxID=1739113 RepID=UPI00076DBF29|nr:glutamate 5-kinase [Novosphingobium sp. FSW06-99]KUR74642.1 glutamate 5-kinase [Novosphingobium sp. FSW06-99]